MFNKFGNLRFLSGYNNQNHRVGTLIKGKLNDKISFKFGPQFGISENSTDYGFGMFLGYKF